MRPIIGVTTTLADFRAARLTYAVPKRYIDRLWQAGAMPVLIPCTESVDADAVARTVDGLLFPGGDDVDPVHYGEEPDRALGTVDPLADAFELALARHWLDAGRPMLGICRGMQLMNVAAGGTLYQDIPHQTGSRLQHRQQAPSHYPTHNVQVKTGSWLERFAGDEPLRVNSFHHQSVKDVATGFTVTATASDGIIEAIEGTTAAFVVAVQWHPELMCDSPHAAALFSAFVQAAATSNRP